MHDNAIIAIITVTALVVIGACGIYLYYLRNNLKKEITIRRVEAQKERIQQVQLQAASASLFKEREKEREREREREKERTRKVSRAQSRGRSRARSKGRRRERSLVVVDLNRDEIGKSKNGEEKEWRMNERVQEQGSELDAQSTRNAGVGRRAPAASRAGSMQPAANAEGWSANDGLTTTAGQGQHQPQSSTQPQAQQEQGQEQLDWNFGQNADDGGGNNGNNSVYGDAEGWLADDGRNETQDTAKNEQPGNNNVNDEGWGRNNDNDSNRNNGPEGGGGGWSADNNGQTENNNNSNGRGEQWLSNDPMEQDQQVTQQPAQEPSW